MTIVRGAAGIRNKRKLPPAGPIICGVIALAAFGPYLAGSVRTEQATVYLFFLVAFLALPMFRPRGLSYLLPWLGLMAVASLSILFPVLRTTPWPVGSLLGGIDNFALPVAVMFIVWTLVRAEGAVKALRIVSVITIWGSVVSSIFGIISTQIDMNSFLRIFWGNASNESTVADNAVTMGRYSGLLNQPAEAGLLYSLALILAVWLYARKPWMLYPAIVILTIGGLLTVSKIFIFAGIPLGFLYLMRRYRLAGKILTIGVLAGLFTLVARSNFLQDWDGFSYLSRLFNGTESNLLKFYTAGRWNEGSGMLDIIGVVLNASPLSGFGFAGLQIPFDSAWTEVIVVSGLLGTLCLAVALIAICIQSFRIVDKELKLLAILVAVLLVGASFGLPAFTANRVATLVWLVVALFALIRTTQVRATTT